ncbi:hypothetical protein [Yaniella halotolerans]|uniref:hypothetical protein n=1 Tax=Yaniella halotolerans TaxID=225453 RepID=UPI0003B5544F|nr:hypothetical protein [Yaniella halotolerans]
MKRHLVDRPRRYLAAGVAIVALLVGVTAPAAAAPVVAESPVQITWDASDNGSATAKSFFGVPVVVPGDSAHRSLTVRNGGPSDGTLTARIVNVQLAGSSTGVSFYDDLEIHWAGDSASMRELHNNGETQIVHDALAQGSQTEVTLEYLFPRDAASGNHANTASHRASFDVEFQISGALPTSGAATDPTHASGSSTSSESSGSAAVSQGSADPQGNESLIAQSDSSDSTGTSDQSGITVPVGISDPDGTNVTTERAADPEPRLDTGDLVLVGGVQNWPILITAILVGVGWAAMRGFRTRPRAY